MAASGGQEERARAGGSEGPASGEGAGARVRGALAGARGARGAAVAAEALPGTARGPEREAGWRAGKAVRQGVAVEGVSGAAKGGLQPAAGRGGAAAAAGGAVGGGGDGGGGCGGDGDGAAVVADSEQLIPASWERSAVLVVARAPEEAEGSADARGEEVPVPEA